MTKRKLEGAERRKKLVQLLQEATAPLPGRALGEQTGVSRQVIVGDITLLKAKGCPIIATSRGYLYIDDAKTDRARRTIACLHTPEQTAEELYIFVDHGLTVKNVIVEHPVYGDLNASIMVSNRKEVDDFIAQVEASNASYLHHLSETGIHLHTIEGKDEAAIDEAIRALDEAGFLVSDEA